MQKCGLLGKKLGHSYSPRIHSLLNNTGQKEKPYEYTLFEVPEEDVRDFIVCGEWDGLNVTIPYKKKAAALCSSLSEIAKESGSVNTMVRLSDGRIYGDNTDAYGFLFLLEKNGIDPSGKKTLVLGNGGACASICAVLRQKGADVVVISRKGTDSYDNIDRHFDADLIVNTTPVGMFPGNGSSPLSLEGFRNLSSVIDIIYNPLRTKLLMDAEEKGIQTADGLSMLTGQAVYSSLLFTGREYPPDPCLIDEVTDIIKKAAENIILIGMPGSGKSTVANELAAMMGPSVMAVDLDKEFEHIHGISPGDYIKRFGESRFRDLETGIIQDTAKKSGLIISTGGGCVLRDINFRHLHQNGLIIWIRRDTSLLCAEGRPLSMASDLSEMYSVRAPLYEKFCDFSVENSASAKESAALIYKKIFSDRI